MNLVNRILQSVNGLSAFPMVMERVIQIINDPRSSAQDVVDVIQFDQSITASVLKVCNSSYFGLRRTVHSLREALVIIGFNQLLEIVLDAVAGRVSILVHVGVIITRETIVFVRHV